MNTLREALQNYLAMRRALGYKLSDAGPALSDFVAFLERNQKSYITIRLALKWAQKPGARPERWAHRLTYVRGLARYRSATDPRTQIPPWSLLPFRSRRAQPYLYTDDEIRLLLKASLGLSPTDALRRWTYYSLLGLLAVSGLRISEALSLRLSDVDLRDAVLTIHGTKFGKSRLAPLHPSAQRVLSRYKSRRNRYLDGRRASDFFFVTKRGTKLDKNNVRRTFHTLSRQTGLRGEFDSRGPRLHDFRHRFAIQTLLHWYRSGDDVERLLPVLSTYLGHVRPDDTYWYLTACPELMGQAVKRLERRWRRFSK
jgi:integrase/recombinase XerD